MQQLLPKKLILVQGPGREDAGRRQCTDGIAPAISSIFSLGESWPMRKLMGDPIARNRAMEQ